MYYTTYYYNTTFLLLGSVSIVSYTYTDICLLAGTEQHVWLTWLCADNHASVVLGSKLGLTHAKWFRIVEKFGSTMLSGVSGMSM